MEVEVEVEVEKGIWWGDAGDDGKGREGETGGYGRGHGGKGSGESVRAGMRACAPSVASTHQQTQAECAR